MNKAVAKNALILTASEAFNMACGVAVIIALARVLGAADLGLFSFAYSVATVIYFASFFGMNDYAIRSIARDPEKAGAYFYNILASRSALIFTGIIVIEAALRAAGYPAARRALIYLVMSPRLVESLMFSFFAYFRAFQKMKYEGALRGSLYTVWTAASMYAIFKYRSIGAVALAQLGVYLLFFIIGFAVTKRFVASKSAIKPLSLDECGLLFKESANISVIQLLIAMYVQTNTILLNIFKGDEATGIYAAGFRFISVSGVLAVSMTQAVFPHLTNIASGKDAARLKAAVAKIRRYLFWAGFAISAGIFALAPKLIRLVYGAKFEGAVLPLYLMAFTPVFLFLNTGNNYIFYTLDREKTYLKILAAVIVFAIAINLVLLPRFGAAGAAMTTLIPEALFFVILTVTLRRSLKTV
ncbi:MAG: flippase [Candidatus Omnitrophica bacterium]|nr:flippase [Candidatus Omnitrophota bacterium]